MALCFSLPTDHFSSTQLDMVRRCGEQYRLRYVEGFRVPPSGSMHCGTAVHRGSAESNRRKMMRKKSMKRFDFIDFVVETFDQELWSKDIHLNSEEVSKGKLSVIGRFRDQTSTLAGGYYDLIEPRIQNVIAVEERFSYIVPVLGGISFVGAMDLVTKSFVMPKNREETVEEEVRIEDTKVGKKLHGQHIVDTSDQLTWYAMAWKKRTGSLPQKVGLRSLRPLQSGPSSTIFWSKRTDDHVVKLLRIIAESIRSISAGMFMPAPPGVWWCSETWCGYWNRCQYRGGR